MTRIESGLYGAGAGRTWLRTTLVVAAALVAACGANPAAKTPGAATTTSPPASAVAALAPAPDPCSLVTPDELGAAIGQPFGAPTPTQSVAPVQGHTCLFKSTGPLPAMGTVNVTVMADSDYPPGRSPGMDAVYAQFRDGARQANHGFQNLSGLGDKAYWDGLGLMVLRGHVIFDISVSASTVAGTEVKRAEQILAQQALTHF
jgi:hypothetical protein